MHLNRLVPGGPRGKHHHHTNADNVYIVKRGEGTLTIEDKTYTVRENDVVYIPAGVRHSLSNLSNDVFEIFEIYAPSGYFSRPRANWACCPRGRARSTSACSALACQFPQVHQILIEADEEFGAHLEGEPGASATGGRLSDFIYPPAAFETSKHEAQEEALRANTPGLSLRWAR